MRDLQAIIIYVVCDEDLKILKIQDDPQSVMTHAEVMTFCILAAKLHCGNHSLARWSCQQARYFPKILSVSRLNRRSRQIPMAAWLAIFPFCAFIFRQEQCEYAVDSFPVSVCQKSRIDRRKLFHGQEYIGFSASKKSYFCGIRVHMIVTCDGRPVEVAFSPGSESDLNVLWRMELDLPEGSILYADGAYNCFDLEDILREDESITLMPKRGKSIKHRLWPAAIQKKISSKRQIVETAFSCITALLPRSLIVRTEKGFWVRILGAILAYTLSLI